MLELRRVSPVGVALAALLAVLLVAPRANAQLHWDASVQAGGEKRFLTSRPAGSRDAGFGPVGQIMGHVALLPLVRVGGYFGHDISPLGGDASARHLTWGGLRVKLMSPAPRGDLRAWAFAGFGYTSVYQPSYASTFAIPTGVASQTTTQQATVQGAGGGFFDVPFGLGASYKFFGGWALVGELGARVGFGHTGSVYQDPGPTLSVAGRPDENALPAGNDGFALGLTVGILLDL